MTATTTFPPTLTVESVRQLFNPASIVLVGATDKSSWSRAFYANLVQSGFAGAVLAVWVVGWAFRMLIRALYIDGNSSTTNEAN